MKKIDPISSEKANPEIKTIYNSLQKKFGKIPHIFLNLAHSPLVLETYLMLNEKLEKSIIPSFLREKIALLVAQINHCNYCLSAHTAFSQKLGLEKIQIKEAREGYSTIKKEQIILQFVKQVIERQGKVSEELFSSLKEQGVSDQEIVEINLIITVNLFTNYFNQMTEPVIDFPFVAAEEISYPGSSL